MTNLPDPIEVAGRTAAEACGRTFECMPMLWRDVGRYVLTIAENASQAIEQAQADRTLIFVEARTEGSPDVEA